MRNSYSYQWFMIADPGSGGSGRSAFSALFAAVDIYKPFVFFADEIYETEVEKTVTGYTGPLIMEKCLKLHPEPEQWRCYYDSAAAWFGAHFRKLPDTEEWRMAPVEKKPGEKEDGLDILNSLFLANAIAFSTQCGNAIWEYDNYARDKNGNLVKRNDHQIDNGRYLMKMANIVAIVMQERPDGPARIKAKNRRDYVNDLEKKKKGKMGLFGKVMKQYDYGD